MGGLAPAQLQRTPSSGTPEQGGSPETIGNCPIKESEGSFLPPCSRPRVSLFVSGMCMYVCECGGPSPQQSALGCSVPLALGVPRALSPSSPLFPD